MSLFGKKNEVDSVPEEVREYYQSEKRERTGLAWLLAVGTLVVTLILAAGIFFGGRWAYRSLTSKDDKKPVATQTQKQTTATPKAEEKKPAPTPTKSTGTTTPNAASTSTPSTGSTTTPKPTTTPATTPGTTSPSTIPSTGDTTPATLVNTGPEDVIAIFVIMVVAGTLYHRFVLSRLS